MASNAGIVVKVDMKKQSEELETEIIDSGSRTVVREVDGRVTAIVEIMTRTAPTRDIEV